MPLDLDRTVSLLSSVVKDNMITSHMCCFVDPMNGVAIAGHRRMYDTGDCLVRIYSPQFDMGHIGQIPGLFLYKTKEEAKYWVDITGLPGREVGDNQREYVTTEGAQHYFDDVWNKILSAPDDERFMVYLNPKMICEFIEERVAHSGFENKIINMEVFDGVSSLGTMAARAVTVNGEPMFALGDRTALIDVESSLIPPSRLVENEFYVVQLVRNPDGILYVRTLREFVRGVRLVVQELRNGSVYPGQPKYSLYDERGNGISRNDIKDMPLILGPKPQGDPVKNKFLKAPTLHINADTLYRALYPMKDIYKVVEMHFKDSVTGIYLAGEWSPENAHKDIPENTRIDAIIGPTSPYKYGKVYMK